MEELLELLMQINELSGVGIEALEAAMGGAEGGEAPGGEAPEEGPPGPPPGEGPPPEGPPQ